MFIINVNNKINNYRKKYTNLLKSIEKTKRLLARAISRPVVVVAAERKK